MWQADKKQLWGCFLVHITDVQASVPLLGMDLNVEEIIVKLFFSGNDSDEWVAYRLENRVLISRRAGFLS